MSFAGGENMPDIYAVHWLDEVVGFIEPMFADYPRILCCFRLNEGVAAHRFLVAVETDKAGNTPTPVTVKLAQHDGSWFVNALEPAGREKSANYPYKLVLSPAPGVCGPGRGRREPFAAAARPCE
jgi:hypothetical protein